MTITKRLDWILEYTKLANKWPARFSGHAKQDIPMLVAEVQRLRHLCERVHDRLLRGDGDHVLLTMCDEANSDELTKLK